MKMHDEKFIFDPVKQHEAVVKIRSDLERIKMQIALLEAMERDAGQPIVSPDHYRLLGETEAKLDKLENYYRRIH
jgi:hypothetical protein